MRSESVEYFCGGLFIFVYSVSLKRYNYSVIIGAREDRGERVQCRVWVESDPTYTQKWLLTPNCRRRAITPTACRVECISCGLTLCSRKFTSAA